MQRLVSLATVITLSAVGAFASPLSLSATQNGLSFSTLFENIGAGQLQITVTNTGLNAPADEGGVLGALFFNISGDPTLSPVSMFLPVGSTIVNGSGSPGSNWEYTGGLNGPGGATQGLSAAGYGLFGSGNFCSGAGCGVQLHGIDWGIVDAAYTAGSGNASISGKPLIQSTAVFVLSGIPLNFDPSSSITNVTAEFTASLLNPSTSVTASNLDAAAPATVPEPSTYGLIGGGLILTTLSSRRRSRTSKG